MDMARLAAAGIAETGIEGGYGSVSRSTAGDWISIGISQWEDIRADAVLLAIPGGRDFLYRPYSALKTEGALPALSALLGSEEGRRAQDMRLALDCEEYIAALSQIESLTPATTIYAAMWCPTSLYTVVTFLKNREARADLGNLDTVHHLFRTEYARAADVLPYAEGYRNRADATYEYVGHLGA